jgi:carboxyl-terminal processing protease
MMTFMCLRIVSFAESLNDVKMKVRKYLLGLVIALLAGVSLYSFTHDNKNFEIAKNLDIYYTLFRELNAFYVDEVNPNQLVKTSIDKMLESLDPYTNFISEADVEDFRFMTTGEYAGIGALISRQKGNIIIAEPYEGFPAQKYGLKAGDILLEVEGKPTADMSTEDVSSLLKGPAMIPVKIKVNRPYENKIFEVDVVREKISIDAVPYYGMLDERTAYIRLANFTQNCAEDVKKAYLEMKSKHNPESLVLDLRSNPGGLLIESVKIMNLFVPKGTEIVSTRGKVKEWDNTYKAMQNPIDTTIRIAVLINRASASASEIIAGAMQDLDRGLVIGTRSFGKGLVQTTRDLSYNAKLKVTTAKYYIPSGRCIQAVNYSHRNEDGSVGMVPDSLVTQYSTKRGRKVYDGGGVVPDVKVEQESLSILAIELVTRFYIFDFATYFAAKTPSIPQPEDFRITDSIFEEFIGYVKKSDFKYDSETEDTFAELVKTAKNEKYFDLASEEFKALEARLKPDFDKDIQLFRSEISDLMRDEIVSRYYYQKGSVRATLGSDPIILKAREVINQENVYAVYFRPGTVISAN